MALNRIGADVPGMPPWLRWVSQQITLSADLPAGWAAQNGTGQFSMGAKQTAAARVEVSLPGMADAAKKNEMLEITVRAESGGRSLGAVKLRVELRKRALPQ